MLLHLSMQCCAMALHDYTLVQHNTDGVTVLEMTF